MNQHLKNYFETNLSLLHEHHPQAWEAISALSFEPMGEIFKSANGSPNLKINSADNQEIIFHDHSKPETEGDFYLTKVPETSAGVVIFFGMGLGYGPLAVINNHQHIRNLFLFEPNPGIFCQALAAMDLKQFLLDPRVSMHIGPSTNIEKELQPVARGIQFEDTHILRHLPSFSFDSAYKTLNDDVFEYVNGLNVSGATLLKQGKKYMANRFENLKAINHQRLYDNLEGAFTNIPAILVSGGPSLDKNIHLLKDAKDKAIIIAVDSALPALLANNIMPNFLSTVDGDEVIYEKIADCAPKVKDISLLCQSHVTPKIAKTFPAKQVFWGFSDNEQDLWSLTNLQGKQSSIVTSWTVAHLSLTAAIVMKASPIIFVGQDLAYTDFKTHVSNAVLTNQETMEKRMNLQDEIFWVDGWDGQKVPTDRALLGSKQLFEKMIEDHPNTYINATEGGARIEGTNIMPLFEALEIHCEPIKKIDKTIDDLIQKTLAPPKEELLQQSGSIIYEIKTLWSFIQKSKKVTYRARKKLAKVQKTKVSCKSFKDLPPNLQQDVGKIDMLNQKIDNSLNLWRFLQEVTLSGLRESDHLLQEIRRIGNKPEKYLNWLDKHLERNDFLNKTREDAIFFLKENLADFLNFSEKEKDLLSAHKEQPDLVDNQLNLVRLYMESNNFVLAKPILDKLLASFPQNAEILFFLGCIALEQREYNKCDEYFGKTKELNSIYREKIDSFRRSLGDDFLKYLDDCRGSDRNVIRNLLLKGLQISPGHPGLCHELTSCASEDLLDIKKELDSHDPPPNHTRLKAWIDTIQSNKILLSALKNEQLADFCHAYGSILALEGNYPEAIIWIDKALHFDPTNAEFHISATSVLFDDGKFEHGIVHLKKAVELDRSYGYYWEEIGDMLQNTGQHDDAVSAYEQCFLAQPGNFSLLKKIGDCYMTTGQMGAAQEAYQQLLEKQKTEQTIQA